MLQNTINKIARIKKPGTQVPGFCWHGATAPVFTGAQD